MSLRVLFRDLILDLRARSVLPTAPRNDDLYLVEFPKSGITWLSFLVANTNLLLAQQSRQVTFFNLCEFVADIHVDRRLSPQSHPGMDFRFIKSHAGFTPQYKRVFYLVRDPRNVMASYYRFITELGWWSGNIEDFVKHRDFGIAAWRTHVEGWLGQVEASTSFLLLRYEDLVADTAGTVRTLYWHLGYKIDDEIVLCAIERSSAEHMREFEAKFNAGHPRLTNFSFVRKENIGGARASLPPSVKSYIEAEAAALMAKLGYIS